MTSEHGIIKLFCVYTFLSIVISILAWLSVAGGIVEVSPWIHSGISVTDWLVAAAIYALGMYAAVRLYRHRFISIPIFALYFGLQLAAVASAYVSKGWIYFPGAGSQGTLPAVAISAAMLLYLAATQHRRPDTT